MKFKVYLFKIQILISSEKNEIINLTRTSDCKVTLHFNIKVNLISEVIGNER